MVLVLAALYTCYNNYHRKQQGSPSSTPKDGENDDEHGSQTLCVESESFGDTSGTTTTTTSSSSASPIAIHPTTPAATQSSLSRRDGSMVTEASVFRDDVRADWMLAVFGSDYLEQPTGLGCVASCGLYQTVRKTLPLRSPTTDPADPNSSFPSRGKAQSSSKPKIGMTLAKVSFGLYVHHVVLQSEASLVGLPAGAVLVRVNGQCVLAEPSQAALERLWQYESSPAVVVLEVWHRRRLYQTALLGGSPWGIAWAPAVQMVSVQRVHALAAKAGVPRHSWLVAVDGIAVTSLEQAGALLDAPRCDGDNNTSSLQLTLGFPPPRARVDEAKDNADGVSGPDAIPQQGRRSSATSAWSRRNYDGVRVTFHPLDAAAVAGLCQHVAAAVASPPPPTLGWNVDSTLVASSEAQLETFGCPSGAEEAPAAAVAAGRAVWEGPPPTYQPRRRFTLQVPGEAAPSVLRAWDPMESLLYCLRLHAADYRPDKLAALALAVPANGEGDSWSMGEGEGRDDLPDAITGMKRLLSQPLPAGYTAADVVGSFLLQCLGIICATPPPNAAIDRDDEKKSDEASPTALTTWAAQQEVTSLLLRVSRKDQGFCQRLYFLLRSFLSTLETGQTPSSAAASVSNFKSTISTTALLALLNCLERLRFAEQQHAVIQSRSAWRTTSPPTRLPPLGLEPFPTSDTSTQLRSYHSPRRNDDWSSEPSECASPHLPHRTESPIRKMGLFGRFRKKKKRNTSNGKCNPSTSTPSRSTPSRVPTTPQTASFQKRKPVESPLPSRSTPVRPSGSPIPSSRSSTTITAAAVAPTSPSVMYENMCTFLADLDEICRAIEQSLKKSFSQKMADWALQPWSPSHDSALARVTHGMREQLRHHHDRNRQSSQPLLLVNPVDSSELLSGVDWEECYILPSAHFPILLSFHVSEQRCSDALEGEERLYRTKVEVLSIKAAVPPEGDPAVDSVAESDPASACHFAVQAAVAGIICETTQPSRQMRCEYNGGSIHLYQIWPIGNVLTYDTRSSWGPPQTLSLRVTRKRPTPASTKAADDTATSSMIGVRDDGQELGYGWVDLSSQFSQTERHLGGVCTTTCRAEIHSVWAFDEHGEIDAEALGGGSDPATRSPQPVELQLKITTECVGLSDYSGTDEGRPSRRRMLLYKHNDDLRQEAFAVQFVKTCDMILKASGLDLKLLTFQCVPVGTRRGFVEWVPGSVPLSEVCEPFAGSFLGSPTTSTDHKKSVSDGSSTPNVSKACLSKYQSLRRLGNSPSDTSRQGSRPNRASSNVGTRGSFQNNPIQDYLRSVAYDPQAPYLIHKDVMDTYVKSCAGYSVITYVLGVGDRHLDNLLLHQSGCFFHCDYSFILGSDPKAYLPVRVTDDMVYGMGGKDSDNFARFVSMMGAAFLALRRPESVRLLLSLVRLLEHSCLPDVTENQTLEQALHGVRDRLRLDLSDQEAVAYMEGLVESAVSSKMALAVDAIHSLGKKF